MTPESIRTELGAAQKPSDAALREAVRQAGAFAPEVLALLDKADRGVFLLPTDARLLLHGIHVLAAARDQRLYRPLLAFLRRPLDDIDAVLGDALTETMARVVVSVFDGDAVPLFAAIEDREADEFARWSLLSALARLGFDGSIAREAAVKMLVRFDEERMAGQGDAAWCGWQIAVSLLGVAELAARARAAWSDGRCPEALADPDLWAHESEEDLASPASVAHFERERLMPIDDPVEALTWNHYPVPLACESAEPNEDPAAAVALHRPELDWLSGFLSSRQAPPSTMGIDELDGLLTALAICPEQVPPGEFMPRVWGTPDGSGPEYDSDEQAEHFMSLMARHWFTIEQRLRACFPHAPLFVGAHPECAPLWGAGLMIGINLRPGAWERILARAAMGEAMALIRLASLEPKSLGEAGLPPEAYRLVLDHLPDAILELYEGWRSMPTIVSEEAPLRRRKVGRNEPCECGSGRKFKRCCGAVAAGAVQ